MTLSAIVLAAGKGTRMKSDLPKPLHTVRGRSLLGWVIHALEGAALENVAVVVGHGRELVVESLDATFDRHFLYAEQLSQRGTGDAAAVGLAELDLFDNSFSENDHVLIVPGDTPLLTNATIAALVESHLASGAAATVVTAVLDDPAGYGRVLRSDNGGVAAIVEDRDATPEQRTIREINGGMYCFRRSLLAPALRMISSNNAQGEMYLTDAIGVLVEAGHPVNAFIADPVEISGVNDRSQLGYAGEHLGARIADTHMRNGVTIVQPSSTVIDATVVIEPDVTVHAATTLHGATTVETGAVVGPNSYLVDATIKSGARVVSSMVTGATVQAGNLVGPFEHRCADSDNN
ncbi:MAG: NTP transferase domain-containing protein [Acidimicrobiaceae bacterium]|jgi:bifunctional UDP-N-acetylglucosamine pyrophosphorylase / glucosamine-1-phosphate N-acetyltransferase|nr:NTP transferase domain-containing protein [Acidimicrobiaceae bacterium]MDC1389949.1 NTP transferase domain-containing protein [Acidimicrobiales bacterium]